MRKAVKRGQIWKQKGHAVTVIITGSNGGRWKAKVLTDKPGVYNGSHTFTQQTLNARYDLLS